MAYHPYHFVGEVLLHPVYCVCSENFKLYLGEISTSQPQYQRRKIVLCVILLSNLVQ